MPTTSWKVAGEGVLNGADNMFPTSNKDLDTNASTGQYDGDLMPGDPGALPNGGGQGPVGNVIDGASCDTTMSDNYHVHAFVGIYVNGAEYALPDAIGIYHAGGDQYDSYSGWNNQETTGFCFYYVHTHDASGLVHIEDPNPTNAPITASLFNLGALFDIWGIQVGSTQFGPYTGIVSVYTSGNSAQVPCNTKQWSTCEVQTSQYAPYTGDPAQMPLYSHEAVWIEVGAGNPPMNQLPGVSFAIAQ